LLSNGFWQGFVCEAINLYLTKISWIPCILASICRLFHFRFRSWWTVFPFSKGLLERDCSKLELLLRLAQILGWLLFTYLHPPSGADEFSGSPGSLALLYMMKVMVLHFVSGFHKVTAACVAVFLQIVVVEAFCAIS
jgi:hypothetical protein